MDGTAEPKNHREHARVVSTNLQTSTGGGTTGCTVSSISRSLDIFWVSHGSPFRLGPISSADKGTEEPIHSPLPTPSLPSGGQWVLGVATIPCPLTFEWYSPFHTSNPSPHQLLQDHLPLRWSFFNHRFDASTMYSSVAPVFFHALSFSLHSSNATRTISRIHPIILSIVLKSQVQIEA